MFFVPTITTLVHNSNVYILCLSTGNYDGLGETRTKELYASGLILGIQQQNIINGFIVERLNEVGNRIAVAVAAVMSTCFEMFNDLMDCIGCCFW